MRYLLCFLFYSCYFIVQCLGTENRRPENPVAPIDSIFPSVVFKGTDILSLDIINETEPAPVPPPNVFTDPAVVSVSLPSSTPSQTQNSSSYKPSSYAQAAVTTRPQTGNVGYAKPPPTAGGIPNMNSRQFNNQQQRDNRDHHRDHTQHHQRGGHHGHRGGNANPSHRGNYHHGGSGVNVHGTSRFTGSGESLKGIREFGNRGDQPEKATAPDFDMEAGNERMAAETAKLLQTASNVQTVVHDDVTEIKPALAAAAYNKSSSFFDNLDTSTSGLRRDEERRLNQETFGSVGLSHFSRGRGRGGYHRGGRGGYYRGGRGGSGQ